MQDDYDIYYEQRRQIERSGGGWGGPLIAAFLVALVTGALLYAAFQPENSAVVVVRFVVSGSADQGQVAYGPSGGVAVERNVGLPWEVTLEYEVAPRAVMLAVSEIAPTDDVIRCELWIDGWLAESRAVDSAGEARCETEIE